MLSHGVKAATIFRIRLLIGNMQWEVQALQVCIWLQILDEDSDEQMNDTYWQYRAEAIPDEELNIKEGELVLFLCHVSMKEDKRVAYHLTSHAFCCDSLQSCYSIQETLCSAALLLGQVFEGVVHCRSLYLEMPCAW